MQVLLDNTNVTLGDCMTSNAPTYQHSVHACLDVVQIWMTYAKCDNKLYNFYIRNMLFVNVF